MSTVEIHGQHVPVPKVDDGETVLDVMIMARVVSVEDNGEMGDRVATSTSPGATFTTSIGTMQRQLWEMEEIARGSLGWEEAE